MNEVLIATAFEDKVRIYWLNSTNLVEEARIKHNLWPTSCAIIGRVMSVTAIMASMLKKDDEKIITHINGGGAAGTVLVEAKGNGDVKGFVAKSDYYEKYENGKLAVGKGVGVNGYLSVTKDIGLKDSFTGKVKLVSGEIGEDFAYYFTVSEQIPSAVSVGVLIDTDNSVKAAGCLLVQVLPGCDDFIIDELEYKFSNLKHVSTLITDGLSGEDIIFNMFEDARILDRKKVRFKCDCSKERFDSALLTLDYNDLSEILVEDGKAEIRCEFCNTYYDFSKEDLQDILRRKEIV